MMAVSRRRRHRKPLLISVMSLCVFAPFISIASDCEEIVISGPPIWPPFVVQESKTAERTGPAISLARKVLTSAGLTVTLDVKKPWKRILEDFESGDIDLLYAIFDSEERRKKYIFTDPWIHDIYGVVAYRGREFSYTSVGDLEGKMGAYYAGLRLPPPLDAVATGSPKPITVNNVSSLFNLLKQGRADYLIGSIRTLHSLLPDDFDPKNMVFLEKSEALVPVHMAISKNSPCADHIEQINAQLNIHKRDTKSFDRFQN